MPERARSGAAASLRQGRHPQVTPGCLPASGCSPCPGVDPHGGAVLSSRSGPEDMPEADIRVIPAGPGCPLGPGPRLPVLTGPCSSPIPACDQSGPDTGTEVELLASAGGSEGGSSVSLPWPSTGSSDPR